MKKIEIIMLYSAFRRLSCYSKRNLNIINFTFQSFLKYESCSIHKLCFSIPSAFSTNIPKYFCSKSFTFDDVCYDEEQEDMTPVMKISKKESIHNLMSCLGCSDSEARSMLKDYPKLKNLSPKDINSKTEFYHSIDVEVKDIINNPWLLWLKPSAVSEKLRICKEIGVKNINAGIPLLGVPLKRLNELVYWSDEAVDSIEKNRIVYLSEKLECDPAEICYAISIHKFIDRLPFYRLSNVLDILLDAGVPPDDILRDIWVLRYSTSQISNRINRAKDGGLDYFKTWMVRCTEKIFNNTLRRHAEKRALLGPHKDSAVQYISCRLGVSQDEARLILSRHPQLRGVGAAKLCNTLDFLLGEEQKSLKSRMSDKDAMERSLQENDIIGNSAKFDRVQVWNSIRALCHSLETMKERLSRLRALGYEPYSPSVLYKSRKKFEVFVKKLEEKAAQNQSDNAMSEPSKEIIEGKYPEKRNFPTG